MAAGNKKFTPRASANLIEGEVTETSTTEEVTPVEEVTPTDDTPVEEEKTEEVTFTAKTDKKPIERMVKICLARDFKGCIGGAWYYFKKGQVVNVPENVKRILNKKEGMLKPL